MADRESVTVELDPLAITAVLTMDRTSIALLNRAAAQKTAAAREGNG